ncbi:MAG: M20 family metallopeptidase [Oscillospiraceae bacterium]|jgi:amidohydrolase
MSADISELMEEARKIEKTNSALYEQVSRDVFGMPEIGGSEYKTVAYLTDLLRKLGFTVTMPYGGLDTAFRAEYGSGSPKVAFLAEYDALPGYGPNKDQNAHACGHSWIAANAYAACSILSALKDRFDGTIVYMGCPSEENYGGKVNMVNAGCFDDIDAAMQIHIAGGSRTRLAEQALAIDSVEFMFHGVSSHASGAPEKGINALDAAYLTFNGINALRQHVTPDVRMHGIINNGGLAPNVVPAYASCMWYIRAADRRYLNGLTQRVINCAKGAALMTGATMEYRYFENSYDDMALNPRLIGVMADGLTAEGVTGICREPNPATGSTDVGNVSHICPTVMVNMAVGNTDGCDCHEEGFLPYITGELGMKALHQAIMAQMYVALRIFTDPELREGLRRDKEELARTRA